MIIQKPITATPKTPYESVLHFERGGKVKFYMRGAIAFPDLGMEGFALFAGQRLSDNKIFIFEQFRFWTIDQRLKPNGSMFQKEDGTFETGLIQFVADVESRYRSCSFYYGGQHPDLVRRYANELYRHKLLSRNFELIEVPFVNEVGDGLIIDKLKVDGFIGEVDSYLAHSAEQWSKLRTANVGENNDIQALRILLAGYENNPYYEIKQKEIHHGVFAV